MTPDEFGLRLIKDCAVSPGAHVLAAVSGGADSTALLCFFAQIQERFALRVSCAHVEHGIRGDDSRADMAFVSQLCERLNIPFYAECINAPGFAAAQGTGLEDAARTLRHEALHRIADQIGADVIALAHHAGDQAETVLLHAARGSDIRGLCAMRMRSGRLIRPLLACTAGELRDYLHGIGQNWREDESNGDLHYGRNRVRREVLPQLERVSPGAGDALCRLSVAAQRDEDYFARQLAAYDDGGGMLVNGAFARRDRLLAQHPALLSRALVRLIERAGIAPQSAKVIEAIMDALPSGDAVINLTGGAHAAVGRRFVCLTREAAVQIDVPLAVPGMTDTPFGRFEVRKALPCETGDGKTAQRIPARLLTGARVTGRRQGDEMIPFGKKMPVKLKKLMIDAGIERAMRASVPVIRREDEVLFAVGLRPSELCRGGEHEEQMMIRFLGKWPGADDR